MIYKTHKKANYFIKIRKRGESTYIVDFPTNLIENKPAISYLIFILEDGFEIASTNNKSKIILTDSLLESAILIKLILMKEASIERNMGQILIKCIVKLFSDVDPKQQEEVFTNMHNLTLNEYTKEILNKLEEYYNE